MDKNVYVHDAVLKYRIKYAASNKYGNMHNTIVTPGLTCVINSGSHRWQMSPLMFRDVPSMIHHGHQWIWDHSWVADTCSIFSFCWYDNSIQSYSPCILCWSSDSVYGPCLPTLTTSPHPASHPFTPCTIHTFCHYTKIAHFPNPFI